MATDTDVTVYASRLQAYRSEQQGWRDVPKAAYHSTPYCVHLARTRVVVSLHLLCAADLYMEPCATCNAPGHPLLDLYQVEEADQFATEEFMEEYEKAQKAIEQAYWRYAMWLQCVHHHGRYALLAWRGLAVPEVDEKPRVVISRASKLRRLQPTESYFVPQPGQRVRHVRYGTGKVTAAFPHSDGDAEVKVVFDNDYRERLMLASMAKFEAVAH